jgi:hypothetical protein
MGPFPLKALPNLKGRLDINQNNETLKRYRAVGRDWGSIFSSFFGIKILVNL